ncbi:MAG TPA: hypothetical protein VNO21_05340, partial [Polyangiaceae bacterium]|nr:hypothetical protein [Polyangiaceae bacterium]
VLLVKPKGAAPESEGVKVATWAADVAYFFPDVAYLVLVIPAGGHLLVPAAVGPAIAGACWTFLDEKQALVEATSASEWSALLERARPFVTQLPA